VKPRDVKTAPWRMKYLEGPPPSGCFICDALAATPGPDNLVLVKTLRTAVMLNRFPYNNGHIMIVPVHHAAAVRDLDPPTRAQLMEWTAAAESILAEVYRPDGFNIGMNIGAAAGAGLASHLHIHMMPRWSGDTNFMTTVADVRVVPERLPDTWERLASRFQSAGEAFRE